MPAATAARPKQPESPAHPARHSDSHRQSGFQKPECCLTSVMPANSLSPTTRPSGLFRLSRTHLACSFSPSGDCARPRRLPGCGTEALLPSPLIAGQPERRRQAEPFCSLPPPGLSHFSRLTRLLSRRGVLTGLIQTERLGSQRVGQLTELVSELVGSIGDLLLLSLPRCRATCSGSPTIRVLASASSC